MDWAKCGRRYVGVGEGHFAMCALESMDRYGDSRYAGDIFCTSYRGEVGKVGEVG